MDVLYSLVESVHVFIPIIAVVSLVVIVFLCGIGQPQNPPDEFLSKIQQLDKVSTKYSKVKQPVKSSNKSKSSGAKESSPNSKETPKVESDNLKQRKSRPEIVTATRKSKEENNEEIPEGEWVTVNPKKKTRSKETAVVDTGYSSYSSYSSDEIQFGGMQPEIVSNNIDSKPVIIVEELVHKIETELPKPLEIEEPKIESPKKSQSPGKNNIPNNKIKDEEEGWSSPTTSKKRKNKSGKSEPAFVLEEPDIPVTYREQELPKQVSSGLTTQDLEDVVVIDTVQLQDKDDGLQEGAADAEIKKKKKKKKSNKNINKQGSQEEEREGSDDLDTNNHNDLSLSVEDDDTGFNQVKIKKKKPRRE